MPDALAPHACSFNSSADYELALILKEIRFITDQVSSWWLMVGANAKPGLLCVRPSEKEINGQIMKTASVVKADEEERV